MQTHPHVVHKMWELKEKQKELRAKAVKGNLELPEPKRTTQQKIAVLANKVKNTVRIKLSPKKTLANVTEEEEEEQGGKNREDDDEIELIEINEDDLHKEHVKVGIFLKIMFL